MSAIVLYYSKSGHTEKLAQKISRDLDCQILRIVPEKEYEGFISAVSRVAKEKKEGITPAFKTEIPDLTSYDVVLVGYPVWYQDIPAFVADFLEHCDLKGKTVVPFAAFWLTGSKWTRNTLERVCKGAAIQYPFDYGLLKKDDYDAWLAKVRKLLQ